MFELARRNVLRSALLVGIMTALLVAVGYFAQEIWYPTSGPEGAAFALCLGLFMFLVSYYWGDVVLLSTVGARAIEEKDAPQLYNVIEEMVIASGLSAIPKIYIIESPAANAFATGRTPEVSAIAVTEGLLRICNRDELQAVIAHEIAHIKNRDILFMTLLSNMVGAIALISDAIRKWLRSEPKDATWSAAVTGGFLMVLAGGTVVLAIGTLTILLAPFTAKIIFFTASRTREYLADIGGATFTRNPAALADALEKISQYASGDTLVPDVAQGMLIVEPAIFESHPPVEQRIAILRKLAGLGELSYERYASAYSHVTGKHPGFMPQSALAIPAVPIAGATAATAAEAGTFRREALDAVKKKAGYKAFLCSCGATIKIPPKFPAGQTITCPGCGRKLDECILTPLGWQ